MSTRLRFELVEDPGRLPGVWDRVVPEQSFLLQRRYLSVLASAPLPESRMVCGLVWQGERLVAGGVFHLVPFQAGRTGRTAAEGSWWVRAFLRSASWMTGGRPHMLLCGHWLHSDARGFFAVDGFAPRAAVVHRLMRLIRDRMGVPVAIEVVKDSEMEGESSLAERRFHAVRTVQPSMRLPLSEHWSEWSDYLSALRKKYRQRARAARRRGQSVHREALSAEDIRRHAEVLESLLRKVIDHAEVVLNPPRAQTLSALKDGLGSALQVWLYRVDDVPVGFSVWLVRGATLEGLLVGLEPEANRELKLYQNILYDHVEAGIAAGVSTVEFGRTALEIKSSVGAKPFETPIWVRHPHRLLNHLLGLAVRRMGPPQWQRRRALTADLARTGPDGA